MKTIWLSSAMLVTSGVIALASAGLVLGGCGAAGDSTDGSQASEEALSGPTTSNIHIEKDPLPIRAVTGAPANTIMKVVPNAPTTSTRKAPSASTGGCGAGEKICQLANDKNICVDSCVPDTAFCGEPNCVVCDPSGPAPQPGCKWDSEACVWLCL